MNLKNSCFVTLAYDASTERHLRQFANIHDPIIQIVYLKALNSPAKTLCKSLKCQNDNRCTPKQFTNKSFVSYTNVENLFSFRAQPIKHQGLSLYRNKYQ